MLRTLKFPSIITASFLLMATATAGEQTPKERIVSAPVEKYIAERIAEFGQIPESRKEQLKQLTQYMNDCAKGNKPPRFVFICTHNSRRSQLAQLWAAAAAAHYQAAKVQTFSGGTEATSFNPRAVAAVERAGFKATKRTDEGNPKYEVEIGEGMPPQVCFSKVYDQRPNPQSDFCAVMTCSNADKNCPVVKGAARRISVPYDDPKEFDGTPLETTKYDERCREIAREMLYAFSLVKQP
jgi:arsenate reductase (thioredoxin)